MTKKNSSGLTHPLNLNFLICSVLTLDPLNNFFKKIDIKSDLYLNPNTQNQGSILWLLCIKAYDTEFYELLNRHSLREAAYEIIKPLIITRKSNLILSKTNSYPKKRELLKKYLKKYKVLYKKYFLTHYQKSNTIKTDKIINHFALHALFLLVGI
jgi:hypothetical protein|uniref:Uncharacterized protein n=2 Tax=Chrysochromulina TaxID=35140 RepID=A0A075DWH4_9EUKA|nr:hypothetical protein [Chrysochromulina parva]AHY04351.1 hypothetical protein ChtoCp_00065 [Chrysochromulina tobinii]AUS84378.1 hypothetical protein [Chrysochromulina parva]